MDFLFKQGDAHFINLGQEVQGFANFLIKTFFWI